MKKFLNVLKTVLLWSIVVITALVVIFTLVSVNTLNKNDRGFLGYKFFIVQTDSMSATSFDAGDIIISKEVDITTLKAGDIITFVSEDPNYYGRTVTHKIREVTKDEDGNIAFVTYGTTTNVNDETLATVILGKYTAHIPKLGTFFTFLKTTPGYIICILIPFLIIMISQIINIFRSLRDYRKEQVEELRKEREKLQKEREENERIKAELLELKAKLEEKEADDASKSI